MKKKIKTKRNCELIFGTILIIVLILGVGLIEAYRAAQISEIGNMVCNENGYGDFKKFQNNKIYCDEKPIIEKYDGGYIVVERQNSKEE